MRPPTIAIFTAHQNSALKARDTATQTSDQLMASLTLTVPGPDSTSFWDDGPAATARRQPSGLLIPIPLAEPSGPIPPHPAPGRAGMLRRGYAYL